MHAAQLEDYEYFPLARLLDEAEEMAAWTKRFGDKPLPYSAMSTDDAYDLLAKYAAEGKSWVFSTYHHRGIKLFGLCHFLKVPGPTVFAAPLLSQSDFKNRRMVYGCGEAPLTPAMFEPHRQVIEQAFQSPVSITPHEYPGYVRIERLPTLPPTIDLVGGIGDGIVFGSDIFTGRQVELAVNAIPHLLVMGTSGFGKSVFLHQIVSQLVQSPEVEGLLLVDLKGGVEFRRYEAMQGVAPVEVIWRYPDVAKAVSDLVKLMEVRLESMARSGARSYRGKRIFFVVDEFAQIQLWPVEGKEGRQEHERLLANLNKLSMLGRAVGIVLITAIQKATTDVMDSSFRANLQGQVCFRVPNKLAAASMFGSTEDLRLNPMELSRGQFIFYEPVTGTVRYMQAHVSPAAQENNGSRARPPKARRKLADAGGGSRTAARLARLPAEPTAAKPGTES